MTSTLLRGSEHLRESLAEAALPRGKEGLVSIVSPSKLTNRLFGPFPPQWSGERDGEKPGLKGVPPHAGHTRKE